MRSSILWVSLVILALAGVPADAATGKVIKVLPEYIDLKGKTSLSPSLYERDAYQAQLRDHPERRSGMRFYVHWRTRGAVWEPLTIQVELRGIAKGDLPKQLILDKRVENTGGLFSHWSEVTLSQEAYKDIGNVTAWRVSLWEGKRLLGLQQSFLW